MWGTNFCHDMNKAGRVISKNKIIERDTDSYTYNLNYRIFDFALN